MISSYVSNSAGSFRNFLSKLLSLARLPFLLLRRGFFVHFHRIFVSYLPSGVFPSCSRNFVSRSLFSGISSNPRTSSLHSSSYSQTGLCVRYNLLTSKSLPGDRIVQPHFVSSATGSPGFPILGFVDVFIFVYSAVPSTTWIGNSLLVSWSNIFTSLRWR